MRDWSWIISKRAAELDSETKRQGMNTITSSPWIREGYKSSSFLFATPWSFAASTSSQVY
jgi:hypothetical protein